jgi:hypothetical protein
MLAGASCQSACTSLVPGSAPRGAEPLFYLVSVSSHLCVLSHAGRARFLCGADEGGGSWRRGVLTSGPGEAILAAKTLRVSENP